MARFADLVPKIFGIQDGLSERERPQGYHVVYGRIPEGYPPIAQSARVSLSMTVAVSLNGDGSPQSVSYENVSGSRPDLVALFRLTVEPAMKASRFEAVYGRKTIRLALSFHFDRDGPPAAVYFLFPNQFEIEDVLCPGAQSAETVIVVVFRRFGERGGNPAATFGLSDSKVAFGP